MVVETQFMITFSTRTYDLSYLITWYIYLNLIEKWQSSLSPLQYDTVFFNEIRFTSKWILSTTLNIKFTNPQVHWLVVRKQFFTLHGRRSSLYMQKVLKFNDISREKRMKKVSPYGTVGWVGELSLKLQNWLHCSAKTKSEYPLPSYCDVSLSTSANNDEQFIDAAA